MQAAESLEAEGIGLTVVNARFARPLDIEVVRMLADTHEHVFTVEEHSIRGGFGAAVLEELAIEGGRADRIRPLALPDAFIPHGGRAGLLQEMELDPAGLAARIRRTLGAGKPV